MLYKTNYKSPIGNLTIVSDEKNLVGVWIEGQKYFANTLSSQPLENSHLEILNKTKIWFDKYFRGEKPQIKELPLSPSGNEFRQEVWQILCQIPYGETITYGEIGAKIAKKRGIDKMSAQAIGGAVGHNPIAIIIPCHRVIGKNGNLTGYAGTIEVKTMLLEHEGLKIKTKNTKASANILCQR